MDQNKYCAIELGSSNFLYYLYGIFFEMYIVANRRSSKLLYYYTKYHKSVI